MVVKNNYFWLKDLIWLYCQWGYHWSIRDFQYQGTVRI
jgi:hypothetical protein